jgi:outer membrane protein TolC
METGNHAAKTCIAPVPLANPARAESDPGPTAAATQPVSEVLELSLTDVVERALKNNVSILVQEFDSQIREQDILDRLAIFDPSVGGEFSYDWEKRPTIFTAVTGTPDFRNENLNWNIFLKQKVVTGADYQLIFNNRRNVTDRETQPLDPLYSSDLQLDLTQPLLKNFGVDNNKREIYIAKNDLKISEYDFTKKVIDTVSDAESVYWDLVFSIEDLKVKEKSLQRAKDFENRVRAQVEVGTLAPLEILQALAEVASREELLLSAGNLIEDTEDNLKNIINVDFNGSHGMKKVVPLDPPAFEPAQIPELRELIQEALQKRPEYLAKKVDLENKNINVKYNENQLFPALDLIGSMGLNGISGSDTTGLGSPFEGGYDKGLSETLSTDFFQWKVGVQLSYPIGNRSAKSRLAASRLEAAQLLMDMKDLEKQIIVEVREADRQIETDIKRVQATRVARKLAQEKLSAEEKKFEVGLSTSFNVLEFQEDVAEEQSNEIKAIIDYNKSRIKLRQVMATTLESHNIRTTSNDDS